MNIRILLADDHRVFTGGMKALLGAVPGFEVVGEAQDGHELIRLAAVLQPDVILTDVQMPQMDGITASREITRKFPAIRIIALTMLNESIFIRKMLDAGVSGYVIKTVDKDELVHVIKKVAAGEKHFDAAVTAELLGNFSGRTSSGNNPLEMLTRREKEILVLIAQGLTDKEIAERVHLSALTVISHRKNLLSKLGLKNKVELTRFALEHGLQG